MSRNNKTNINGFARSMENFYQDVKLSNYASALRMRSRLYEELRDTTERRLDMGNTYSLYQRTGALYDTIEPFDIETKYDKNGAKARIGVGWKMSKLNNHRDQSHWGESVVDGTHRSFFGSAKYGTSIGDAVPTPIILNDMKYNLYAKQKNNFYRFIEDTMSYYSKSVYAHNSYIEAFNESMEEYASKTKR